MAVYIEQVGLIPVSRNCSMAIYATGQYGRKEIQSLITMLQLQVDLGCFDNATSGHEACEDDTKPNQRGGEG